MSNIGPRAERLFEQIDELIQRIFEKENLLLIRSEDIWQSASKGSRGWSSMNPAFKGRLELGLNEPRGIVSYTLGLRVGHYFLELERDDTTVVVSWRQGYTNATHEGTFCLDDAVSYELLIGKIRWLVLQAFTLADPLPRPPDEVSRKGKQKLTRTEKLTRRKLRRRFRALRRRR